MLRLLRLLIKRKRKMLHLLRKNQNKKKNLKREKTLKLTIIKIKNLQRKRKDLPQKEKSLLNPMRIRKRQKNLLKMTKIRKRKKLNTI